jgi:hypothetical protein
MYSSRGSRLALLTVLAGVVAAASIAPNASAATQRYASPTGTGTACTSPSPCNIRDAVGGAITGDEVIVNPGDYPLTETLFSFKKITIRGIAGRPRPRLLFSGPGQDGLRLALGGSTLRYVEIDQAGEHGALFAADGASVDQVIARASTNTGAVTANIRDSAITNSIVVATGTNGAALGTENGFGGTAVTSAARNVTAIATGSGGIPILANAGTTASATLHLVNAIAYAGPGAVSLKAQTDGSGAQAAITVTHTNYQSVNTAGSNAAVTDGGGNRAEEPAFVNPAAGDYRQAPGAYTIDAGLDYGGFDVDGDPRKIRTTDIGADEFVPAPTAVTGPAGAVTGQSATLSGGVTARGVSTTYHFQYGSTTAYGGATPKASAGAGAAAVAAAATLGGLRPGTAYHYRIVATNAGGVAKGVDRTFTTVAPPAGSFAGVALASRKLTYARRFITVRLSCPAGTVGRCSGRTKLTARRPTSSRRVTLGRGRFAIAPDKQASVRVRVSRAGRRLLRRMPRLRGRVVNAAGDSAGQSKITKAAVTIRRRDR